jgi:hypothetical protein
MMMVGMVGGRRMSAGMVGTSLREGDVRNAVGSFPLIYTLVDERNGSECLRWIVTRAICFDTHRSLA